jgi:hypothetical protein
MRPHLATHRHLTVGMLALLMVWHNHRVFPRGVHQGHSPLELSGMAEAGTDWLEALGYGKQQGQQGQTSPLAFPVQTGKVLALAS